MENEKTIEELFNELKSELDFLPDNDHARQAFIDSFAFSFISS